MLWRLCKFGKDISTQIFLEYKMMNQEDEGFKYSSIHIRRRFGTSSQCKCKFFLFAILILCGSEILCEVEPGSANVSDGRKKEEEEEGKWNNRLSSMLVRRVEKNLTTETSAEVVKGILLASGTKERESETISLDESINNSSLPFRIHFSLSSTSTSLLLRSMTREKRAYGTDEDHEKMLEDHARSFRLFYFLGGIAIVIFSMIFLATLLCFCCPSCYMAKRRRPGGGESISGSGNIYQSSGSTAGAAETTTTISAARSSSIVMATLPLQHRLSQDYARRRSQDYNNQNPIPSTSQGFTYSGFPETTAEIN